MTRVFLVDDEIAIREGIRNSFPWEESGYTLVGEAPDGEVALPMIRDTNPDILITDIRMPFMDGMQLCREVRRLMPWIGVIILSGYDEFEYARQAIQLRVQEYLLKPVTSGELRAVLDRTSQRLAQERRDRENVESMQRRLQSGSQFLKDKLLASLFSEDADESGAEGTLQQMRALGIHLAANRYAVIDAAFSPADKGRETMYALAESSGDTVYVCSSRAGARALVLGDSDEDTEERAYAFAASASRELADNGCSDALLAIGETVSAFADIRRSMQSARHIRHAMSAGARGDMRIVGAREMQDVPAPLAGMRPSPDLDIHPLHERVQYTLPENLPAVFAEYVASLGATNIHGSVALDYLRVEALMTATRIVRDAGGDPAQALDLEAYERHMLPAGGRASSDGQASSGKRAFGREQTPGDGRASVSKQTPIAKRTSVGYGSGTEPALELLAQALGYQYARRPGKGHSSAAEARYYLSQHFTDSDLMLQDVAKAVRMSNSRFSTVFAQETGYTFTEYLTALRIGKAKELLAATDMRSSEIASAVGYNDAHYFSYLFKKNTGVTPSDYRRGCNENKPHPNNS